MVRRGSVMVRRESVMVRSGSVMVGRGSVDSASACYKAGRVRFSARHHRVVFPTELTSNEEMVKAPANGDGYMYCMNVIE